VQPWRIVQTSHKNACSTDRWSSPRRRENPANEPDGGKELMRFSLVSKAPKIFCAGPMTQRAIQTPPSRCSPKLYHKSQRPRAFLHNMLAHTKSTLIESQVSVDIFLEFKLNHSSPLLAERWSQGRSVGVQPCRPPTGRRNERSFEISTWWKNCPSRRLWIP